MPTDPTAPLSTDARYGERTVRGFLDMAIKALTTSGISTARLDSEMLLMHRLNLPREWLLAHDDAEIAAPQWAELCADLVARCRRCPLAYIAGHKEFYGRDFVVTPAVLIPRPESEQMITSLNKIVKDEGDDTTLSVLDLGTGSGCLAVTAKLENPRLDVTASDISADALAVAKRNAAELNASGIKFVQSDLFSGLAGRKFDIILANLPYVDKLWKDTSPELAYEPKLALYADNDGLAIINKFLTQAPQHIDSGGYIVLEADRRQMPAIIALAKKQGFEAIEALPFTLTMRLLEPTRRAC